ncbi:MAG TPA: type II toxin-antitoxin system prevent-host-death family antitoxin [Gaiellaceae bacterium]|nr:type II toxin-antitoxin system prevent-host-death family antitoxin [Gaiellaceae bacterium]
MGTQMGIRELRDNLTAAVRRVRAGETIEVTNAGEPVALLVPVPKTHRERLIAEGLLIPAKDPLGPLPKPVKPLPGTPTSDEIIADDRRE